MFSYQCPVFLCGGSVSQVAPKHVSWSVTFAYKRWPHRIGNWFLAQWDSIMEAWSDLISKCWQQLSVPKVSLGVFVLSFVSMYSSLFWLHYNWKVQHAACIPWHKCHPPLHARPRVELQYDIIWLSAYSRSNSDFLLHYLWLHSLTGSSAGFSKNLGGILHDISWTATA